jgi:hypothetical protein
VNGTAQDQSLRNHLMRLLDWGDAHADFERVVAHLPAHTQGVRPEGLPYSLWQLLEHMRLSQADILDFCRNPQYRQPAWPAGYWPRTEAPPSPDAWERSADAFRADRQALIEMVADPGLDLFAEIEHGEGQTYLREVLLAADHGAYHLGEMVAIRRLLGVWE